MSPSIHSLITFTKTSHSVFSGAYTTSTNGETFDLFNPATEELLVKVSHASQVEVDSAVAAAEIALPAWRKSSSAFKAGCLLRLAGLIRENVKELGELEAQSMGVPVSQYPIYAAAVAAAFEHFAGTSHSITSTVLAFGFQTHVYFFWIYSFELAQPGSIFYEYSRIYQYDAQRALRCLWSYLTLYARSLPQKIISKTQGQELINITLARLDATRQGMYHLRCLPSK